MYEIDDEDRVAELTGIPQSSIGAPMPVVVADEHHLLLGFLLDVVQADWTGEAVQIVDAEFISPAAIVRFSRAYAWFHGPPNDEAFEGHPLTSRGLKPYSAFQVERSSWLGLAERRNRVHEHHDRKQFDRLRHYVLTFHDTTFECLAEGFEVSLETASPASLALLMAGELAD